MYNVGGSDTETKPVWPYTRQDNSMAWVSGDSTNGFDCAENKRITGLLSFLKELYKKEVAMIIEVMNIYQEFVNVRAGIEGRYKNTAELCEMKY